MSDAPSADAGRLLAQARQGEGQARGELLENYRAYLALLARLEVGRRLQTKLDASDVVQETFLEAHRNFENFRGQSEGEFVTWLKEILSARLANLVRRFVTQGRDMRRETGVSMDLEGSSRVVDRGLMDRQTSPSQHVARRELTVAFARALERLPEDYREVIIARHFEECPFTEVAARLDRSVDSVQKLWVRGLARLKQLMPDIP
jgi:RNA polymerase sigma-70 factor (ECF subfamily)